MMLTEQQLLIQLYMFGLLEKVLNQLTSIGMKWKQMQMDPLLSRFYPVALMKLVLFSPRIYGTEDI